MFSSPITSLRANRIAASRHRISAVVLVGTTLCLGVAGCTSDSTPSKAATSSAGGSTAAALADPVVKWADSLCSSVSTQSTALPPLDSSSADPVAYRGQVSTFLQSLSDALGKNATSLQQIGAPPISSGSDVLSGALSSLTAAKGTIDSAKSGLDAATVSSKTDLTAALANVSAALSKANYNGPVSDLQANADLRKAITAAPSCAGKS